MTGTRSRQLTRSERWKLDLLANGMAIEPAAREHLDEANRHRALTPADYASTSGLILALPDDVWVNVSVEGVKK